MRTMTVFAVPALLTMAALTAQGQMVEVAALNTFHAPASNLSLVPGGLPGFPEARYTNFNNKLYRTPTTNQWVVVATTNTGVGAQDQVFILGTGRTTQVLAQEGVTSIGVNPTTLAPEYLNFSGLAVPRINDAGQWTIGFGIAGGSNFDQRLATWTGSEFGVLYPGDPAPGGRTYMGTFNSANIFNNAQTGFMAGFVPSAATHESAVASNAVLVDMFVTAPTGQSTPTNEPWTDLDTNGLFFDATGTRYIAQGKVGLDTLVDQVAVVDGVVRIQEGTILAGSGYTSPVSQLESVGNGGVWMESDGTWFAMGRNADATRWVVRNGVVIAQSATPITPGSTELWETFRSVRASNNGHYVLNGNTSATTLTDDVLVVDGTTLVARESDPVDLDADGTADNSLYVHLVQEHMVLLDDGYAYFAARLKSDPNATGGANGNNNASLLRIRAFNPVQCGTSDYNGDGDFGTDQDIEAFFACLGGNCCPTCFVGGSDFNGDGDFGTDQDIESFFRVLGGGSC